MSSVCPHPARASRCLLRAESDERLARLAGEGSEAAFELLVTRHRAALVWRCARLLGAADAEEAVQDALLRALAALRRGDDVRRVGPWLHVIAQRTALNALRLRREHAALDGSEIDRGADRAIEGRERARAVIAAVSALPERQREAIVMHELEGRSYDEIAARLDATPGAVRQLLHRARTRVRERVAAVLGWMPLLRWATDATAGAPGPLSQTCVATARVCAALVPAVLGVGGLAALHEATPRSPHPMATRHVARRHVAVVQPASATRPGTPVRLASAPAPAPAPAPVRLVTAHTPSPAPARLVSAAVPAVPPAVRARTRAPVHIRPHRSATTATPRPSASTIPALAAGQPPPSQSNMVPGAPERRGEPA